MIRTKGDLCVSDHSKKFFYHKESSVCLMAAKSFHDKDSGMCLDRSKKMSV